MTRCYTIHNIASSRHQSERINSVIIPIYKKGDPNNPDSYRGISLTSILSKIFASIIHNRYAEDKQLIEETRAGFLRNYSTVDYIFTLCASVEKQFTYNRKHYMKFIDSQKAYDDVQRLLCYGRYCYKLVYNVNWGPSFKLCMRLFRHVLGEAVKVCHSSLTSYRGWSSAVSSAQHFPHYL